MYAKFINLNELSIESLESILTLMDYGDKELNDLEYDEVRKVLKSKRGEVNGKHVQRVCKW